MAVDVLLNESNNVLIEGGDLVVSESSEQHITHILLAELGSIRFTPFIGASIRSLINDDDVNAVSFKQELRKQLELDGATVSSIKYDGENITINAIYGG